MVDFFVLVKSLIEQVKGLVIQETRPEGFLVRTDKEPVGRVYISPATSDTVLFWIPEDIYLTFNNKHEIPAWLSDFLEKRTKERLAKWTLNDAGKGCIYTLEYMVRMNDLTPQNFEKICYSMFSEHLTFLFWANTVSKIYQKPLSQMNPEPIDIQIGLPPKKGG